MFIEKTEWHNEQKIDWQKKQERWWQKTEEWGSISYLFLYQIPCKDTHETNYLCIFADGIRYLNGGVTYWWTILIALVILWFTDFYQITIHAFFISFIGIELHLKTKVIMTKKPSPYIWLGLASLWLLICPIFFILGFGSSELYTFYALTIVVNLFCSYKFGAEKGIAKGLLFFISAILCDLFFSILSFLILWGLSSHN